jgi:hypothetical protein
MKSPYESADFKRWARDMRKRLIPEMRSSGHVLMIAPNLSTDFDIEFALQIGATILLEKPLILLRHKGRIVPPKLLAIADRIIEADLDDPVSVMEAQEQVRRAMSDFERQ